MDDNYLALVVISTLVFLILVIFIVVFSLLFQKRQLQNIKDRAALKAAFEQEIYKSQAEVQNQTMQNIGKELHDNIGQLLTVAKIHLHVIEELPQEEELRKTILEVSNLISTTIHEVRQLTKSLDGDFLKDFGLVSSISNELERIQNTGRFKTELIVSDRIVSLGFQKEIILFRVVQETINNAIKHAAASQLSVSIATDGGHFTLVISDNGKGFESETLTRDSVRSSSAGLRNIKNRIELLEGTCTIFSKLGVGTKISVSIPI